MNGGWLVIVLTGVLVDGRVWVWVPWWSVLAARESRSGQELTAS